MTYKVTADHSKDILYLTASGEYAEQDVSPFRQEVYRLIEKHSASRVLIDVQLAAGRPSSAETFRIAESTPEHLRGLAIAVVDRDENWEWFHFHETLVQLQGFKIAFFSDVDKGRKWLKQFIDD